jgi:peptidoglycan/LPS O-acetylase OafA/YrhL
MSLVLLAIVAGGVGALVRRWWLLALPLTMGVGAALLLAIPGSTIDPDNPLVFLVVLLETALAAGILSARYAGRRRSPLA